jgi:DNA-binding transcriptional LysR family regulator
MIKAGRDTALLCRQSAALEYQRQPTVEKEICCECASETDPQNRCDPRKGSAEDLRSPPSQCRARSRWVRRRKLELAELIDAKWILYPPNEPPGLLVEQAFRLQQLAVPRPSVTTSSFHLRDALLMTGEYLTVVPACMLRVFNAKHLTVKSLPIDLGLQRRPVAIFTLKNRTLNPVAEIVIKCIRAVATSLLP